MKYSAILLIGAAVAICSGCRHEYEPAPPPYYCQPAGCGCAPVPACNPCANPCADRRALFGADREFHPAPRRARLYHRHAPARHVHPAGRICGASESKRIGRLAVKMEKKPFAGWLSPNTSRKSPSRAFACEGLGRSSPSCTPRRLGCGTPFTCQDCRREKWTLPTPSALVLWLRKPSNLYALVGT